MLRQIVATRRNLKRLKSIIQDDTLAHTKRERERERERDRVVKKSEIDEVEMS